MIMLGDLSLLNLAIMFLKAILLVVVLFIKMLLKTFEVENETFSSSKPGRKPYALHKRASLVYYSYARGFTKASVIEDMAKNHTYFKFVANLMKTP